MSINLKKLRKFSFLSVQQVTKKLDTFVQATIVVSFSLMALLSLFSILTRWFTISFLWIDPLIRHLILIISFLGAYLAIVKNKNIKIELFSEKLQSKWKDSFIAFLCSATCFYLYLGSYNFFLIERTYGKTELLGLHSSLLVAIVPVGFILLSIRFLFASINHIDESHNDE